MNETPPILMNGYTAGLRVRLALHYHDRRRDFFGTLSRLTQFLLVLAGTAAASSILSGTEGVLRTVAALALAALGAAELVFAWTERRYQHDTLFRRWAEMQAQLVHTGLEDAVAPALLADMYRIEADEPPRKGALASLCHNEVLRADGHKTGLIPVPWYQRALAHWWNFEPREAVREPVTEA